jgi:hypothetical protein
MIREIVGDIGYVPSKMFRKRWSVIGLVQAIVSVLLATGAPAQFEAGRPNLGFLMFGASLGSPAMVLSLEARKYRRATMVMRLLNQHGLNLSTEEAFRLKLPKPDEDIIEEVLNDPSLSENPQLALEVMRQIQRSREKS